jgi:N-methylhydantoinase A
MLMTDLRRDYLLTKVLPLQAAAAATCEAVFADLTSQAEADFRDDGISSERTVIERLADFRYKGQEHTVKVGLPSGPISAPALAEWTERFHADHERQYAFRLDAAVEIVTFHLVGRGLVSKPELPRLPDLQGSPANAVRGERDVDFDAFGIHATTIYERDNLAAGAEIAGPAIVEEAATTLLVPPGWRVRVDAFGNLRVRPVVSH